MEIADYPNYLVYDDGRIFSIKSRKMLKTCINSPGYHQVGLCKDGKQKMFSVHRLVAQAYIPNPNNYPVVDHIDRNKTNNHVSNLRWVTHFDNSHNMGKYITNTSGHKNIHKRYARNSWTYIYRERGVVIYRRCFPSKIDCLCYKFICLLRQRVR